MNDLIPESAIAESLSALHEVVQKVAWQRELSDVLALAAERARFVCQAESIAIALLDPTRTLLDFAAVSGGDAAEIIGQTIRVENFVAGRTAQTGEVYLYHTPEPTAPAALSLTGVSGSVGAISALLVVPIFLDGKPAGAMAAQNHIGGTAFSGPDLLMLQAFANVVAIALKIDGSQREVQQKQRERDLLFEAAKATSSSLNVQDVLSGILVTLKDSVELNAGAVYLLNDERSRLSMAASTGLSTEESGRELDARDRTVERALSSADAVVVADSASGEYDEQPMLHGMRSVLAASVLCRSMPEGLIVVGARRTGVYSEGDGALLSAVAAQAGVALENALLYEDAVRRTKEAAAIYELSQAIGSTLQLDTMLNFVADSVSALLQVDKFALFLLDEKTGSLRIRVSRNIKESTIREMSPRRGEGIAGWVLEFETPTAIQDVPADHRNASCPLDDEHIVSLVSVPLQAGDRVIGVMHAMSARRRFFTVSEMELLYTIANQAGSAVVNARMFEQAQHKSEELRQSVRRVTRALGSSADSRRTAQVIVDLAADMIGADRSVLLMAAPSGGLSIAATHGVRGVRAAAVVSTGDKEMPAEWIFRRRRSLMMTDLNREEYELPAYIARERVAGFLGVPVKVGGHVLGVLEIYSHAARSFKSDEVRLLITVAAQAAVALQNALLIEQAGRRVSQLQGLHRISELLGQAQEADSLVSATLPVVADALEARVVKLERVQGEAPLVYRPDAMAIDEPASDEDAYASMSSEVAKGQAATLIVKRVTPFDDTDRTFFAAVANLLSAAL